MKKIFLITLLLGLYAPIFSSNQPAAAAGAGAGANIDSAQKKQAAEADNVKFIVPDFTKDLNKLTLDYLHAFEPISEIPVGAEIDRLIISADNNYLAITVKADRNFRGPYTEGKYKTLIYKRDGIAFNKIDTIITNSPQSIALSPDGKYLAIGMRKGGTSLFKLENNHYVLTQEIDTLSISLSFWQKENNLFLGCGGEHGALVYTLQNNRFTLIHKLEVPELHGSPQFFPIIKFAADGSTIVIESKGLLYIYKLQQDQSYTGTVIKIAERPQLSLTLSPDGKYLAIEPLCWSDEPLTFIHKVAIWQLDKNIRRIQELKFNGMLSNIKFSHDASYLCIAPGDTINIFKKNDQNIYQIIYKIEDKSIKLPNIIAFTPDIFHAIGVLNFQDSKVSLFRLEQLAAIASIQ